ncbi:MAG TPA: hypothetical protein IAB04_00865 [Candidatus Avimonoglobus intestinipullorum]|uniref:Copper amine oxidase-like N-terminal domain-containing protein n=1 Tax=Candidatus Avimonoglobus intestinipullorum TaxID=2840699 RepID=A0A9D1LTS0_9FIRM|nr:hypothetical protein [Candidatus Avimonoglobus intestinipullorum]
MKERLQGLAAGILIGGLGIGGVAYAISSTEYIEVVYDNIKVYKDNVLCNLRDANGSVIEPFIYNGTTYLPVRGTAELAGLGVSWDGATKSVYLWDETSAGDTYLVDVCPPYDGFRFTTDNFYMANEQYEGFTLWGNKDAYALVNLNGKYDTATMYIGPVDGSAGAYEEKPAIVNFYLDGKKVDSYEISEATYPFKIELPLNGALQLKVELKAISNSSEIGFGTIRLQ